MIDYLKKRKLRKQLKEYLHAARHARHMREDIADPRAIAALKEAEAVVREIRRTGEGDVEKAVERMSAAADAVYPSANNSGIRENVEVVIVALAAAMAIRAFFFQPFKIPTGSMQPTLNGITIAAQAEPGLFDRQPLKFVKWLLTGESYKVVRAKASGTIQSAERGRDAYILTIGGVSHKVPVYMLERQWGLDRNHYYKQGEVIIGCGVIAGDHILVNKMKYNFMHPERGDIAVFDTRHIVHPQVREKTFYIKRMVGLPGEKIQIQNKEIVADGQVVREPPMFAKIATDPTYQGHTNAGQLATPDDVIQLTDTQYLMMGDNTENSLDGRFFGGVDRDDFLGPAFFVYWPFRSHWGVVH
ncbi:MAG: signal peptidase I [Kiritimatiellales bacterium]|nr:signal peptidase I [Kiritimatiellales bacterium]MCF7863590.1 signal peptidase I [Kiritimatiellales bacterium]